MEDLTSSHSSLTLLDPTNELHLFCLHYIFIPRINRHLHEWKQAWIMHPMQSENHQTPYQLYMSGMQRYVGSGSALASEMFERMEQVSSLLKFHLPYIKY